MAIIQIKSEKWTYLQPRCLQFFEKYGDKRITKCALTWLANLKPAELLNPGTIILFAIENRQIIACIACSHYGIHHSIIAVRPENRKHKIGDDLLKQMILKNSKFYATVAIDNIPSLQLCFANEMTAFLLINGPTGKPTLWLGGGNWSKEDVKIE